MKVPEQIDAKLFNSADDSPYFKRLDEKMNKTSIPEVNRYCFVDEWMTSDFTPVLTVFRSNQGDGKRNMEGCVQWNSVYG